ncbi:hypothetical protein [Costertonia aggregata]|uniref:YbjN domain-containing protein n=1 Tax=Costertonia aggregata TaxID=343403 RepID=A0A7H9ASQ7_9FLAO|nr:hypothetical protein [Costertonia aggregata]QLG46479.1 hypothetical protein HYG79_14365 [Costertonia aggregata]
MCRLLLSIVFFFGIGIFQLHAQDMNPDRLKDLIIKASDTLVSNGNSHQFIYKARPLICVYDEKANRMRIVSPIIKREEIGEEEILNALVANFHLALDVKYALSDEIIWSVFIHPLKELSDHQILDAIEQVHAASVTFGSTYSSTTLVFPGNTKKKEEPKAKKLIERS